MNLIVTARNIQQAVDKGLKELGKTQDEVDIKIIEEGGFFKKAKIEIIYDEAKEVKKVKETKVEPKKEIIKETKKEIKVEPKTNTVVETETTTVVEESDSEPQEESLRLDDKYYDEMITVGTKFLEGLFKILGQENTIETNITKDGLYFSITGENVNDLIGYRGESLNALQTILSNVIRNNCEKSVRILVDVENYKLRRENTLVTLATRLAHKAAKLNKPVKLEPMRAYDRRVIHACLTDDPYVTTKSEGEEPNRYVVIIPNKK